MVEIAKLTETDLQTIEDFEVAQLGSVRNMSIQYFRFPPGSTVPVHSHEQAQIGFVYTGKLTLTVGGEDHIIESGDAYFLESDEPHGGENCGEKPVEGVDVFNPPRDLPNWAAED